MRDFASEHHAAFVGHDRQMRQNTIVCRLWKWYDFRCSTRIGKYYVADLGLRRALVGDLNGEDIDQMLENVVCREFLRCGWKVTVGRVREKEVDFVCQKAGRRRYVQVAYLMPTAETREREFSALESVPDHYEKIVLSLDRVDFSRNGVRHVHLPAYLVELSGEDE